MPGLGAVAGQPLSSWSLVMLFQIPIKTPFTVSDELVWDRQ
jgi:hypothetical protein